MGGITVIRGVGAGGKPFLAVPFYALANRGASAQEVWAVQRGLKPGDACVVWSAVARADRTVRSSFFLKIIPVLPMGME